MKNSKHSKQDPPGLTNDPPGLTNDPPGLTNDPPGDLPSGQPNPNKPNMVKKSKHSKQDPPRLNNDPPGLTNDPPGDLPSGQPNLNKFNIFKKSKHSKQDPSGLNNDPPGLNNDPPGLTNDPPGDPLSGQPNLNPFNIFKKSKHLKQDPPGLNNDPPGDLASGQPNSNSQSEQATHSLRRNRFFGKFPFRTPLPSSTPQSLAQPHRSNSAPLAIPTVVPSQPPSSISELGEARKAVLEWLSPDDFEATQMRHLRTRFQSTGQWLLDDPRFQSWRDEVQSRLLWCYGARK